MAGQFHKIDFDSLTHELKLFITDEKTDEALDGVGSLFGPDQIGDIFFDLFHDVDSLIQVTDCE